MQRWFRRRQGADGDSIELHQRRIYILPTRIGLGFGVVLFTMLLGALNYSNNMGFALAFLLTAVTVVSIHHCQRNLTGLRLTVDGTFGEALVLETVLLSILNHDCAVASAAARMDVAAGDRATIEGGGRRTHPEAAVDAALAAYIAGIDVTSNLEAGRRFGLPTAGTTMHAFTLAHRSEADAFAAQIDAFGPGTTFLVDTYDTETGIRRAVEAAGPGIGAIRIDSGDIGEEARRARALLDELGATGCKIVVSGDLDEFKVADLADAPIDRYLLGTRLVTGSGAPTAELVYKLVAIADDAAVDAPMRPVAKTSPGKGHRGGRKVATRVIDGSGHAVQERVLVASDVPDELPTDHFERGLQVPWMKAGEPQRPFDADAARAHHLTVRNELPPEALRIDPGPAFLDGNRGHGPARTGANREAHEDQKEVLQG